jgi:spore coat polysaccharide biosynthesis protein SpsF
MTFKTEQEAFWAGDFGTDYIQRNQGDALLASNLDFFAKSLRCARGINSCIEFGANIGMNLKALKLLHPSIDVHAIEINSEAAKHLGTFIPPAQVHNTSILDFAPARQVLPQVYDKLVTACGRYLMVGEYYNPAPVAIPYRGHSDRLFKRDFAGEIMDRHPQLQLVDYGFAYRRDPNFPQDDITWFLMENR